MTLVTTSARGSTLRRFFVAVFCIAAATAASPVRAGTMTITPALRQAAVTSCTGDALRLCPTAIFDEQKVFACMKANRTQLTPDCGAIFDQGARTVGR